MNCKDCIHCDVCYDICEENFDEDDICRYCQSNTCPESNNCSFFKDKSLFIELPCKVGDKIYIFNRNQTKVQEMVLDKPDIRCHCVKEDDLCCCMPVCRDVKNGICAYRFKNNFNEMGKTAFLTREEAEAKLKELEREQE